MPKGYLENGIPVQSGRKHKPESILKMREIKLGKKHTQITKDKIGNALKGKLPKNWNILHTEKVNKKRRKSLKDYRPINSINWKGKNHPHWLGGKSFEEYTIDWTKTLKRSIKERDHYICYLCKGQEDLIVHHIDYDKKNCNPENLITLCNSCHTKTNYNRNYWIKYFNEKN